MTVPLRTIKDWGAEVTRFSKAQFSTAVATGLEWALLTLLVTMHVNYLIAAVLGAILGAVIDFSMKKWWAFDAGGGLLHAQGIKYAFVSALSAGLNCLVAYVLVEGLKMSALPALILASVLIGIGWNYPMHRLYVFSGAVGKPHKING
jgi:putative flippase GtrA